jgi:hypothetical protein
MVHQRDWTLDFRFGSRVDGAMLADIPAPPAMSVLPSQLNRSRTLLRVTVIRACGRQSDISNLDFYRRRSFLV